MMMHAWTEAVGAARLDELPDVMKRLSQAFDAGEIDEAEFEAIWGRIEERRARPAPQTAAVKLRTSVGSRPRTDASMERRRRWAASGRLPPQVACLFTQAEVAVLAVVAVETIKRGDCRLYHEQVAAMAGVSRSTVRATLRRARELGIVTVEERRSSAWRNLSSIVRIASREWTAWNRLVRRSSPQGGGAISPASTNTRSQNLGSPGKTEPPKGLPMDRGRPDRMRATGNRGAR